MKKVKLKITGMHCVSCALSIDGDLEDFVEGVIASSTNYAKQKTEVEFDEKKATVAQILEQVKKTGYTAEVK